MSAATDDGYRHIVAFLKSVAHANDDELPWTREDRVRLQALRRQYPEVSTGELLTELRDRIAARCDWPADQEELWDEIESAFFVVDSLRAAQA